MGGISAVLVGKGSMVAVGGTGVWLGAGVLLEDVVAIGVGEFVDVICGAEVATFGTFKDWPAWINEPQRQLADCS